MKRWIALLLAMCMLTCCVGGLAEGETNELAQVTQLVKSRLGIEDDYEEFYGDYYESAGRRLWNLTWNGQRNSLYVTSDTAGTIYEYYRNDPGDRYEYSSDYAPALPSASREDCLPVAEAFLASVVGADEGWTIEVGEESPGEQTEYTYRGYLTVNGYEAQISLYVRVRIADKIVTQFSRSDSYARHLSFAVPEELSSAEEARAALEAAYRMELHYVLEDGKAVLRYLPVQDGPVYINAGTGEPFEVENLYIALNGEAESTMAMDAGAIEMPVAESGGGLTEVELMGIAEQDDLLTREQLDNLARSYEEFGLTDAWELVGARVLRYGEDEFRAILSYAREVTRAEWTGEKAGETGEEKRTVSKSVTLDAKTGELLALWANNPYFYGEYTYDIDIAAAQATADAFLARYYADIAPEMQLTDSKADAPAWQYNPRASFEYTRVVNGALFEECQINLEINANTGYVNSFSRHWAEDVEFESAENLISAEEALRSYLMRFEGVLTWVSAPMSIADYNYIFEGVLCYQLVSDARIEAVDAHTGECIEVDTGSRTYAYGDIQDCPYREQINALARYGIGFAGDAFLPDQELNAQEALVLLLQAGGYSNVESWDWDRLLSTARSVGIVQELSEDAPIRRAWLARTLIAMSGYGKAAGYTDIYVCAFADAEEIAPEDFGYIAIAQGMGVAAGDENGSFRPADICTRAEAMQMLYAFLTR